MNKELLQKRLTVVEKQLEQLMANYNLLIGSKQEIKYWIDELSKEPKEEEEK